jgi:hypothetical protein
MTHQEPPQLRVIEGGPPKRDLLVSGDLIVELEDMSRLPWGEPTFEEWDALPFGPPCPNCGGTYFGTLNARGYLHVRSCHGDADHASCGQRFRAAPDEGYGWELTAIEIVGRAIFGARKRFAIDRSQNAHRYPELRP